MASTFKVESTSGVKQAETGLRCADYAPSQCASSQAPAAKHGVVGLSKGAAVEYAAQGIRVNAICPGWVETPMTAEFGSDPQRRKLMLDSSPMHRTARPQEIAETIFWLCSDAAGFITGDAIAVDGGQTI